MLHYYLRIAALNYSIDLIALNIVVYICSAAGCGVQCDCAVHFIIGVCSTVLPRDGSGHWFGEPKISIKDEKIAA